MTTFGTDQAWYVGVDIGGTFTDVYVTSSLSGTSGMFKVPTTPSDPSVGVVDGLRKAAASLGMDLKRFLNRVAFFGHASTIGTNLIVERKGSRTGLLTTAGFPDSLGLQRLNLTRQTFDLGFQRMTPLVDREDIREIAGRIDSDGKELVELDSEAVRRSCAELVEQGVESIAVAYLWAFRNNDHERRTREIINELFPHVSVSLSHEVVPLLGEYERTSSTVLDAYVAKATATYLSSLSASLSEFGLANEGFGMQTVGGIAPISHLIERPLRTLNSGPVAGVAAAAKVAAQVGIDNLVAGDMGGTSFDVSLVVDGVPVRNQGSELLGFHTLISTVEVRAVGAGGGSLASLVDGRLEVGPQSAGADPGPACYGLGGNLPTVTDALVVMGIIDASVGLAGGDFPLDRTKAVEAINNEIATPLNTSVEHAAVAIFEVVTAKMADAIRVATVRKGYDLSEFSLMLFGGAGPAHGWALAKDLGIREVVIPSSGSVLSAFGLVYSDIIFEEVLSVTHTQPFDSRALSDLFSDLAKQAVLAAEMAGVDPGEAPMRYSIDVRYEGQLSDVTVPISPQVLGKPEIADEVTRGFVRRYESIFGPGTVTESARMVATRLRAELVPAGLALDFTAARPNRSAVVSSGSREVHFPPDGSPSEIAVYEWDSVGPGSRIEGPCLIVSSLTTAVVGTDQEALADSHGNLRISEVRS